MKRKNYALFMALPGNDFSTNVLYGAQKATALADSNIIIFPTGLIHNFRYEMEVSLYRYQYNVLNSFLASKSFDGAVVEFVTISAVLNEKEQRDYLSQCSDMPIVLLAKEAEGFCSVSFDNASGIRELVSHFAKEHGYTKICFLSGPKDNSDARIRLDAYRSEMDRLGLLVEESMIAYGSFAYDVKLQMEQLLRLHPDMEALLCANDDMAMGAIEYLTTHGRKVGCDIGVSGFDDLPKACISNPPLTTVKADARKLSYHAMRAVIEGNTANKLASVKTEMVVRNSCGCESSLAELKQNAEKDAKQILSADESLIQREEQNHVFFGEIELLMREAIYYQDDNALWMEALLKSFLHLGYESCYLFFYDELIEIQKYEDWVMPERINLVARYVKDDFNCYEMYEKVFSPLTLFDSEITDTDKAGNFVVIPLFYMEKHFGMIIANGPVHLVRFAYQLGSMVSNAIAMIRIQQTNRQLMQQLENANQAKSQFLANMSHEIRTPINAIVGMNEMIRRESAKGTAKGNLDDTMVSDSDTKLSLANQSFAKIRKYSEDIDQASNSLLGIINDILDLSRIESNKLEIIPVEYNLKDLIEGIFKQVSFKQRSDEVSLRLDMDQSLPSVLLGDDLRIGQILINLLGNAVKYTQKGEVILTVSGYVEASDAHIRIKVSDTGIGIKEDDLAKLFAKFERIEEKRNRGIEGSGLGISITVSLLELMGSELMVQSEYGKGSEFSFELVQKVVDSSPICEQKKDETTDDKEIGAQNGAFDDMKVLVVDDTDINREIIMLMLEDRGIHFDEAENGVQCLEKMKNNSYDLVLLDHMMPVMDGMETMEHIRNMPGYVKGKPAVAIVTANAIVGAKEEYIAAGFDEYLSKPIKPDELEDLIRKYHFTA